MLYCTYAIHITVRDFLLYLHRCLFLASLERIDGTEIAQFGRPKDDILLRNSGKQMTNTNLKLGSLVVLLHSGIVILAWV